MSRPMGSACRTVHVRIVKAISIRSRQRSTARKPVSWIATHTREKTIQTGKEGKKSRTVRSAIRNFGTIHRKSPGSIVRNVSNRRVGEIHPKLPVQITHVGPVGKSKRTAKSVGRRFGGIQAVIFQMWCSAPSSVDDNGYRNRSPGRIIPIGRVAAPSITARAGGRRNSGRSNGTTIAACSAVPRRTTSAGTPTSTTSSRFGGSSRPRRPTRPTPTCRGTSSRYVSLATGGRTSGRRRRPSSSG